MIVVTLGTNEQPFDRLVRAARTLPSGYPLLVQYGSSREAHGHGEWVDFLSFDELAEAMTSARVVVSHAGVGSILLAHRCGRRPIVVPRLVCRSEAVDDHQLHFARRMQSTGLLTLVEDEAELPRVVTRELERGSARSAVAERSSTPLADELRTYLQTVAAVA
jgi:UDP-N-acetylglucosamine transferase subunit ALG13